MKIFVGKSWGTPLELEVVYWEHHQGESSIAMISRGYFFGRRVGKQRTFSGPKSWPFPRFHLGIMYHADGQYDRATPRNIDIRMHLKIGNTIQNTEWLIFDACPFCTQIPRALVMLAFDHVIMSCCASGLKM